MLFSVSEKGKYKAHRSFKLYDENIDIVDSYTYLGVVLNYNALYALCYKLRNLTIPSDLQLKLFDCLIAPITVYSCEIWGFKKNRE